MREIKPEDVPQLMLEGKLRFGMELEFFNLHIQQWTDSMKFIGFDPSPNINPRHVFCGGNGGWYSMARFPLPNLRDGDPVVVWDYGFEEEKIHRHFHSFNEHGLIMIFMNGETSWSRKSPICAYNQWRLPTKQELSESGYTEDQINEMMERWGTK